MIGKIDAAFLIIFLCIPSNVWADDFQVPDKAIQGAYCEGVLTGIIQEETEGLKNECASKCDAKIVQITNEAVHTERIKVLEIMNYLDLYEHHDNNTTNSLMNFTIIGIKDWKNWSSGFVGCFGIKNSAEEIQCVESLKRKYSRTIECSNFDPIKISGE